MKMKKKWNKTEKLRCLRFFLYYSLIFNFHFEFLIFIEKYDCVVCVVQRQRKKKFNMKMIYIILKLIKFQFLNFNIKFIL